jgi:hypothetical protein
MADTFDLTEHFETNARHIPTTITDSNGDTKDLTGASATYVIKDDSVTDDASAYLELTGSEGGVESGIEFTTPASGILTIQISTDALSGTIDWTTEGMSTTTLYHRLDVTDSSGNLVTVFTGDFELVAD